MTQGPKKRIPIRIKVLRLVLRVSLGTLLVAGTVALIGMLVMRNTSRDALIQQLNINLYNSLADKATLADTYFDRFSDEAGWIAGYIHDLYVHPDDYAEREVLPPDASNRGTFTMQRFLRDGSVALTDVEHEIGLFGTLEPFWNMTVRQNEGVITSIYLCTESGAMVSYDAYAEIGNTGNGGEQYFDYSGADWYTAAAERGTVGFTDIYRDAFGHGLTVTCYAPFYGAEGELKGVVCMDILIADLYEKIVSMDLGADGYVLLIDGMGQTVDPRDSSSLVTIDQVIGSSSMAVKIVESDSGFDRVGEDGAFYAYAPVNEGGWTLCIRIPEATVLRSVQVTDRNIQRVANILIGALIVLVVIVALASRRFARSLTAPLTRLGEDAKIISQGDLDHRLEVVRNDEFGDLARHFNDMAANLKSYIEDLTRVTAERERIGAELNVAAQIQADMLPRIFPPFPDRPEFDLYATMDPAKEVGGDFYDFFLIDSDHLGLVMADVSGKGVPAALFMVIAKTLIKNRVQLGDSPTEALRNVNDQLCQGNDAELFVTVWLAVIRISTGEGVAVNAGHEHPVVRRKDGSYELVVYRHAPAVATFEGIRFPQHDFRLYPGDTLFVYTDGVPEATNAKGEMFGCDRMLATLNADPDADVERILQNVKRDMDRFVGEAKQFDDITMLCLRYHGREDGKMDELRIEASVPNLDQVLAFVDEKLEAGGCPMRTVMQINVAVEEIFVNISSYAYAPGSGEAVIGVSCDGEKREATVELRDSGVPFDPLAKPDPDVTLSAEEREIGGLGIFMVKKSMDSVEYAYRDGQNTLRLTKRY